MKRVYSPHHDDDDDDDSEEAWEAWWNCTVEAASELAPTTATTTDTVGSASQEAQQLKAEVVELKTEIERLKPEVVQLKFELKAVVGQHVASEAAYDDVTQKLKQMVEKLMAQVTAFPDDDDQSREC